MTMPSSPFPSPFSPPPSAGEPASPGSPPPWQPPVAAPVAVPVAAPVAPAGWYWDAAASQWRWWDGWRWGPLASAIGSAPGDEARSEEWFPTTPTLRLPAAVAGTLFILAFVIAQPMLGLLPDTAAAIAALGLLVVNTFGMPLLAWWCSRRWGTGRMRHDLGLRFRWIDLPLGIGGGLALVIGLIVVSIMARVLGLPDGSNLTEAAKEGRNVIVFAFLVVTAGLIAPIVEELLFRGVIMRGAASKVTPWVAVGVQALVFGGAHFTPSQGWGNVTLMLSLGLVGFALGTVARATGRIATSMIAHATFNLIELGLLWLTLK